jgi:hypothetical protein
MRGTGEKALIYLHASETHVTSIQDQEEPQRNKSAEDTSTQNYYIQGKT